MIRVLLIQIRDWDNPMAEHELECVERRFHGRRVQITARNAKTHIAEPEWLDGQDALVIGGSGAYSVHDPRSTRFVYPLRDLLERALEDDIPGFGICFGHQLLGHHLGVEVVTDDERAERGTIDVELTERGKDDPLFSQLGQSFRAHTGHTDHVTRAPDTVQLLARTDLVETQAFKVTDRRFYTAQFHPDVTAAEARARYEGLATQAAQYGRRGYEEHAERFELGRDETEVLLGRFLDLYFGESHF
jgi:GMP synthase (glutamine-hydrolysing)